MEMQAHLIEVIFDGRWTIGFKGNRYGPCSSKSEAVATATTWVENGRRQGHDVTLAIRSRPQGADSAGAAEKSTTRRLA